MRLCDSGLVEHTNAIMFYEDGYLEGAMAHYYQKTIHRYKKYRPSEFREMKTLFGADRYDRYFGIHFRSGWDYYKEVVDEVKDSIKNGVNFPDRIICERMVNTYAPLWMQLCDHINQYNMKALASDWRKCVDVYNGYRKHIHLNFESKYTIDWLLL